MVLHLLTQWEHLRFNFNDIIEVIIDDTDLGVGEYGGVCMLYLISWQTCSL